MKKFKFRLEKVLVHRERIKEERLRDLMLRNHELREMEGKLSYLETEFLKNEIRMGNILLVEELQLSGAYGARLKDEILNQKVRIEEGKGKVQEAMDLYIEASKEAKALSTLKEKRLGEFTEHVNKVESDFLDELAVQRAGFRKGVRDEDFNEEKDGEQP